MDKMWLLLTLVLLISLTESNALTVSFTNNIVSTQISEDATYETQLTLITIGGAVGTTQSCDLNPSNANFWVKIDPTTGQYGLYLIAMPSLDFNTDPVYSLNVECTDGVSAASRIYTVNINKNQSPTVSNLGNYTSVDSSTVSTGYLVFSVAASDPEGGQLTMTMVCKVNSIVSPCPFNLFNSGDIVTTSDFHSYTVGTYNLEITITDDHSNQIGPYDLTVTVSGLNTPPVIDSTITTFVPVVQENSALGKSVYQVTITDPDADTWTYSASFNPIEATNYFYINSAGLVYTSTTKNIDFETIPFTTCTASITVSDGQGSDTKDLTISIVNVNEPPVFSKSMYTLIGSESVAGTIIGTPLYGASDPEGNTIKYGVSCPTLNIRANTGRVKLAINYDRDDTSMASSFTCDVTVNDGSLTSTATLQVFINAINDNTPAFAQNSYSFHLTPYDNVGDIIGQVVATDADVGSDGILIYSITAGTNAKYFGIDQSGNLYIKSFIDESIAGMTSSITVKVEDHGGLQDTVTVNLVVQSTSTTAITTTTDRQMTFFDSPANVAWFSALMLILLGLASYLAFEMYRTKLIFKICNACNDCKCPERRRHMNFEDYDEESIAETPSLPKTPESSSGLPMGWEGWNTKDKHFAL